MIGTIVTCTICNEPSEIVADAISLPYVCPPCQQEADDFQYKIAPANAIGTPAASEPVYAEGDPGDEHEHHDGCCDTATIENTTRLIADLEDQVAAQQEALAQSDRLVEDMKSQMDYEQKVSDAAIAVGEALQKENSELEATNAEATGEVRSATATLTLANAALLSMKEKNDTLQIALEVAHARIRVLTGDREELQRSLRIARRVIHNSLREIRFYISRGFWARVTNARYKHEEDPGFQRSVSPASLSRRHASPGSPGGA